MQDSLSRLKELYERYLSDRCTGEERKELMDLIAENKLEAGFQGLIDASFDDPPVLHPMPESRAEAVFVSILNKNKVKSSKRIHRIGWWAAAAIFLAGIMGTWYLLQNPSDINNPTVAKNSDTVIQENHTGAILTLSDGKQVPLDNWNKGILTTQDGATVELTVNGLEYHGNPDETTIAYNTMSTPRGRQFTLKLPDGTEVMLNAASSIRYPVAFRGNERVVQLEGEAWFNVKKDASKPFKVEMARQAAVEVLGTSFNIRCYPDEPVIKTTLLSGSVKYLKNDYRKILLPGQQIQQFREGSVKLLQADTSQVMAWKNGEFSFQKLSLEEAIGELARWYDLEPVFAGKVPEFIFYGAMGRNLSPQQVVNLLNNMGLHVSLENNKLIIAP